LKPWLPREWTAALFRTTRPGNHPISAQTRLQNN
jgi:hypothetical protein